MDTTIKDYLSAIGKRGGRATRAKGTDYRALGRRGASKRWGNPKSITAVPVVNEGDTQPRAGTGGEELPEGQR